MRLKWPLTGRSEEMRLIEAALSDPDSSGIVICGGAGVGKSRITREALDCAASTGCEVRWVMGTSSARSLPLGALASWVGAVGNNSLELVRGAIQALTAAPPGKAVVVGVDDVPVLDDLSTFVVHQIIQRRTAKVVLTVRDGEPIPVATQELWKGGQFARLDLQPLSRDAATALVSATLGGPLDPDVAQRLWTLTQGNVLYLLNIVEQEVAEKRLAQRHGYWRWTGDPVVSPGLIELIESRIGTLPESISDVVDALAVGEPIELGLLTAITSADAVEEADTGGLILLDTVDGRVEARVAHPLYGEVRRRRAPAIRLRRLRGLVATELANSNQRDEARTVIRRAALSLDSDLEPDPDLLLQAAQHAVSLADMPLVDRLAKAAKRAGAGPEASFIQAYALSWLGECQEADAVCAEIRTSQLTDTDHARLIGLRASNMLWGLADPAGAKEFIDEASRTAPVPVRHCVDAFLTVYWYAMGRPEAATRSSKTVALNDLPAVVGPETAWAIAATSADAGRTTDALAAAEKGYTIAARTHDVPMQLIIADAHIGALLLCGRIGEAWGVADRLRQQSLDYPGDTQVLTTALAGRAALSTGRLDTACTLLTLAADASTASRASNGWAYRYQVPRTTAFAMSGSVYEATAALAALEQRQHPSWRCLDYELAAARAWVAAACGAITEAIATVLSAAETVRANGQFAAEVMLLQTATQFGEHSCAPRLHELEAIVEGPRVGAAARFAVALGADDAAELAAVSEDLERMGDLVAALDAASHAAVAYRRQGPRGSALGCSTRAEALAEQCGGARTPALRQAIEPLPLTDREREIVMLIGEGLSNKQIAERLTVSVRTVESHIYRAMERTGTTSRAELAALLPRRKP